MNQMFSQDKLMYLPHPVSAVQFLEARRFFELQQIQNLVDKQQHCLQLLNSLGPLRQLTMAEKISTRHQAKPYTSFSIRDILEGDKQDNNVARNSNTNRLRPEKRPPGNECSPRPRCSSTSSSSSLSGYSSDRHCENSCNCSQNSPPKRNSNRNLDTGVCHRIIRPWCPPSQAVSPASAQGPASTDDHRDDRHCSHSRGQTIFSNGRMREDIFFRTNTLNLKRNVRHLHNGDNEEIDVERCDDEEENHSDPDMSPLGALVAMSTNAFKGLESFENPNSDQQGDCRSQIPKKKRKTRTAFTNQQIYELEKRFIMQKYLTPADRDEIASKLGLSCAQVITWFQNRRAKFKRDIDEVKKDSGVISPPASMQQETDSCTSVG